MHIANFSASAITVQIGQVLGKGHNPNSWLARMAENSCTCLSNLNLSRDPNPKKVATMTSKVKDFLPTWKIDLEKEDVYSEAPVEGGPKVTELSEDLVDSKINQGPQY